MIGICHWLRRIPGMEALLGQPVIYLPFGNRKPTEMAVWGCRSDGARAARLAARAGVPWRRVAHGFLRSPGRGGAPLSVVVDDAGIYENARAASRLEGLVAGPHSPEQRERARSLMRLWRAGRVSEFNDGREERGDLPPEDYVLVIDQAADREAMANALADASSFQRMLECALAEYPERTIVIKAAGPGGHIDLEKAGRRPRVRVLRDPRHAVALLERAEAVYTVSSPLGFEALIWEKPVRTFGMPFYAGWGLTDDAVPAPDRRRVAAMEALAHAALVEYSRYRHPETGVGCEVEEALDWLALQRRMRERFPVTLYAAGFSPRKRRLAREFLQGSRVRFVADAAQAPPEAALVLWGGEAARREAIRLEDGFLRSVGLGAGMARPLSWVADRRGIYYDATRPSDMEHALETMRIDPGVLERARRLREAIVAGGVTKYNLEAQPWKRPAGAGRVILVPGQVETDASLRHGALGIKTNLGLLQAARAANPEAYLVYKPHPDVVAGLRARGKGEDEAAKWCDEEVTGAAMGQMLTEVDEVHVLTSLAGFEGLLRGREVTCHGQPFYAGWGLTRDVIPVARRTRRLSLDELVAVALIVHPTYISRVTGHFTTAERVLEELRLWRMESAGREGGAARRLARRLTQRWFLLINEWGRRE